MTVTVAAPAPDQPVYNIDFPGGSPEQLIQQMTKASGVRPNVIVPSYVTDVQLPKFKLQNVTTSQIFGALNSVSDEKGVPTMRWLSDAKQDAANRVWTLAKIMPKPKAEAVQVVFIGHLLTAFQVDDINAAIRTAWDMAGPASTASLKFHKETKILIAKGTEEELKLALDVLKSLEQAAMATKRTEVSK